MANYIKFTGTTMKRMALAALASIASLLMANEVLGDTYGNSLTPTGPSQQLSATTSSGTVTLSPAAGTYVYVMNEGANVAYVTCQSSTATVPGGSGPNSTPVAPNGGGAIIAKPFGKAICAGITASSTTTVDFTPVTLF